MQRTLIVKALASHGPHTAMTLCGWIRTRRDAKGFSFLEINDGSCLANIQCIVDEGSPAFAALEDVNTGAAVQVKGDLVESPGKGQKWELRAHELFIFGKADQESYPLQKNVILTNFSAPSPTCARVPTNTAPPSASAPPPPTPSTIIFAAKAFTMSIPRC